MVSGMLSTRTKHQYDYRRIRKGREIVHVVIG